MDKQKESNLTKKIVAGVISISVLVYIVQNWSHKEYDYPVHIYKVSEIDRVNLSFDNNKYIVQDPKRIAKVRNFLIRNSKGWTKNSETLRTGSIQFQNKSIDKYVGFTVGKNLKNTSPVHQLGTVFHFKNTDSYGYLYKDISKSDYMYILNLFLKDETHTSKTEKKDEQHRNN